MGVVLDQALEEKNPEKGERDYLRFRRFLEYFMKQVDPSYIYQRMDAAELERAVHKCKTEFFGIE